MKAKYKDYTIIQASNNHIAIFKDKEQIFYSSFDRKLNYEQLLEYLMMTLEFINKIGDE